MNDEDKEYRIIFKRDVAVNVLLKAVLLLMVLILPILVLAWTQDILAMFLGEPDPLKPAYLVGTALLLGWFVFGLAVVLPRAGVFIDQHVERWFRKRKAPPDTNDATSNSNSI